MAQPGSHNLADLPALLDGEQVLPDDVAVSVERRHVGLHRGGVDRGAAARRPPVPLRQIAPEILQRRDGIVVDVHLPSSSRSSPCPQ
jgi:hypothetical protein